MVVVRGQWWQEAKIHRNKNRRYKNKSKKSTSAQNSHIVSEHKAIEIEGGQRAKLSKVGVQLRV